MEIESTIYETANALLEGHFILSSGKHSEILPTECKGIRESKRWPEYLAK